MLRILPIVIELVLLVVCLIDAAQTPQNSIRNLPKWLWMMLIVVVPIVGPIAWLVAGRPRRNSQRSAPRSSNSAAGLPRYERPPASMRAPDDNPEFLASIKQSSEHERLLQKWEEDLKRREDELRKGEEPHPDQS